MTSVDVPDAPLRPDGHEADLRRLARGSALNLAGSFIAASLNLVLPVIITRSLTQEDAGLFFQATAVFAILINVGTAGADTGVLRSLPQALVLHRRHDLRRYLVLAIVPAVAFSVLLAGMLILAAGPMSQLLTNDAASADSFREALVVLAVWIPVAVAYVITMSSTRGLDSVRPLVFVEKIGRNALETGAAGLAATLSTSLALIVTAWVAPYAAMLLVVAAWVLRRLRRVRAKRPGTARRHPGRGGSWARSSGGSPRRGLRRGCAWWRCSASTSSWSARCVDPRTPRSTRRPRGSSSSG